MIGIDDGTTLTHHKTINATCVEKKLGDKFSGWELDVTKPIEELVVMHSPIFISCTLLSTIYSFQINCTLSSHCDYEPGVDPIPVSQEGEVQFSLHLNLFGEPQTVSGPMEIGESISIQCSDPGS